MSFNDLPNEVLDIIFNDLICVNNVYKSKREMKSTPLMLELKKVFNDNFCAEHFAFSNLARNYSTNKTPRNHNVNLSTNLNTDLNTDLSTNLRTNLSTTNLYSSFALYPQDYQPSGSINISNACLKCTKYMIIQSKDIFSGITNHGHFYRVNL